MIYRASLVAQFHLQCRRHRFDPWVRKIPWRRKWQPTLVFLPGKSHGQGPWGRKIQIQLSDQTTTYECSIITSFSLFNSFSLLWETPVYSHILSSFQNSHFCSWKKYFVPFLLIHFIHYFVTQRNLHWAILVTLLVLYRYVLSLYIFMVLQQILNPSDSLHCRVW